MEATTENGSAKPATDEQKSTDVVVESTQQVPAESDAAPAPTSGDGTAAATSSEATPSQPDDAAATGNAAAAEAASPPVVPRVVIVTGASSGLGFEVAKTLCEAGHDVILACRNEEKTNRAIEKIRKQNPNAQATYMALDLASFESVRKFVEDFKATGKTLSVLINNGGVSLGFKDTKRQYTKDNFELTMGTNHLGHFLLTNLLLDDLKASAAIEGGDARIVVISSGLHDAELAKKRGPVQPLDFENLFLLKEGTYTGLHAYKNSKLANLLFTYELSRQLDGTGVKVNAVDPGFVPTTEFMRHATPVQKFFTRYILHGMLRFTKATRTASQAGSVICSVATGDKFKDTTGKYIRDGAEVKSSDESLDEEKQKKLWELSGGYTHLEGFEPLDAPTPPAEPVKEEPKQEQKSEEVANGDATKAVAAQDGDNKVPDDTNKETDAEEKSAPIISEDTNKKIEEQVASDNKVPEDTNKETDAEEKSAPIISEDTNKKNEEQVASDNKVPDDTNNADEKPETQEKVDDDKQTEEKKDAEKEKEEEKKETTESKD